MPYMSLWHALHVPVTCPTCPCDMFDMFLWYVRHVPLVCSTCSFDMFSMFLQYVQHAHNTCSSCKNYMYLHVLPHVPCSMCMFFSGGPALDMYFFQPLGRRIERLAMRFTIWHLHPLRIEAFIHGNLVYFPWLAPERTLGLALQDINTFRSGSTIIAGLKGLIQQAL